MSTLKKPMPSLEDRVRAFRDDLDAVIDAKAEELKAQTTNVPLPVIRNLLTNRSFGCQCQTILNLENQR